MQGRVNQTAQAVILSLILFGAALLVHEAMHLVILYALGGTGVLLLGPWRLASANYYIYGFHVQSFEPLGTLKQALLNFLGPILAAVPLTLLVYYVKSRIPRTALVSNILILVFYALIEVADVVIDSWFHTEVGILGTPEFNYGVPLLLILLLSYWNVWKKM